MAAPRKFNEETRARGPPLPWFARSECLLPEDRVVDIRATE